MSVFSNFPQHKYFLGMPRQNSYVKAKQNNIYLNRGLTLTVEGLKHLNMHSTLSYRKIIPDHACQILKLSRVRSGQSLKKKASRIFLVLPEIALMTEKTEDLPPSLTEIKHQHLKSVKHQLLGLQTLPKAPKN